MPIMPRHNKKATKVAFAILGKPSNLVKEHLSEHERYVRRRLFFEDTRLSR